MLTHIDLFSGVGGFALAAEWAGFKTMVFCEIDPFCQEVLKKNWPKVPVVSDIRRFEGLAGTHPTLLTGGPPCQRTSVAAAIQGKRTGETLWPEMARVIRNIKPIWIIVEQPPGNKKWENQVKADLEDIGYFSTRLERAAKDCGAPHTRRRMFIVANAMRERCFQITRARKPSSIEPESWPSPPRGTWRATRTGNSGVDDGLPYWVDRIKALGNAVVPQIPYEIIKEIARIENE